MADVDSEQDSVNGVSNLGSSNHDNMRVKTKKFGSFANAFQAFVAWTFLLAVVAAFVLLVMMKVSFLADPCGGLCCVFSVPFNTLLHLPHTEHTHTHTVHVQVIAPYFLASKHDKSWGSLLADNRCKCVCPHNLNLTVNTTVWLASVNDPSDW